MTSHKLTMVFATALALVTCALPGLAEKVVLPEKHLTEQLKWAEAGESSAIRCARLEAFWYAHLPREDGGTNPKAGQGYEDGAHVVSIVHCAWQLARACIETGQTRKALKMVNWLAEHESKTGLAPVLDGAGGGEEAEPDPPR